MSTMLKLLLNHWQVHREPAPFILTDDPLYCAHLSNTTSQLPEVYSVNRVNPIFEEDEEISGHNYSSHKRTYSENETRSSDDTGYISGPRKTTQNDDDFFYDYHLSSDDSDELPKSVVVSADVHREANTSESIVTPNTLTSSCTCSTSRSSDSLSEPYDSLTTSNDCLGDLSENSLTKSMKINPGNHSGSQQTEVKTVVGNNYTNLGENFETSNKQDSPQTSQSSINSQEQIEESAKSTDNVKNEKSVLMHSLTRVHEKVPKTEIANNHVTKSDSTTKSKKSATNAIKDFETVPPMSSDEAQEEHDQHNFITRRDESISTNSSTNTSKSISTSKKVHRHHKQNISKPITLHQLLPGHWSYDNIYLPQMTPRICYHCLHHNPTLLPVSETELFFPPLQHQHGRSRHSWAPQTVSLRPLNFKENRKNHSSRENSSIERRYSPDGSSQETESDSQRTSAKSLKKKSAEERRSLRMPKKCKCEECLSIALDNADGLFPQFLHIPPTCPCCYMPHRRVKFASDTDLNKQRHIISDNPNVTMKEKIINPTFPINLHKLNGHVKNKTSNDLEKEGTIKSKSSISTISRGKKEPIKMDSLYRAYPINFQDWESHYRRKFLLRRRKRALNMVGMAIGIILVVGVAIAMTFIFLKLKRPT